MDLDEWEVLPEEGFLLIGDAGTDSGKKLFSRNQPLHGGGDGDSFFNMNYFVCPPSPGNSPGESVEITNRESREPASALPPPLPAQPVAPVPHQAGAGNRVGDENKEPTERVTQVFFKKKKDSEFPSADMKLDHPAAVVQPTVAGELFKPDRATEAENFSPPVVDDGESREDANEERGGRNIWSWGTAGIGAIFGFGVVAVVSTVCILFIGRREEHHHRQIQNFRFDIYGDEKRIKQMVREAGKMNGAAISGAHLTFGGHHEPLHTIL